MGSFWDDALEGSKQIGEFLGYNVQSRKTKRQRKEAQDAATQDPITLDQAALAQQESDRLTRRKGVLANIYGGASNAQPTVGTKTLLGQ